MMTATVKPHAFANGFDYFCQACGRFFSVQIEGVEEDRGEVEYCPMCCGDNLTASIDGLLEHCEANITDPVNFYQAFPPDEPIPGSCTGATRREVETIIGIVTRRKREKRPVTIDLVATEGSIRWKVVRCVFSELHLTETRIKA